MYSISKKKVGVDISDRSIEIAEMVKKGTSIKVSKLGRVVLKEGIVKWGEIKDEAKLKEAFIRALKEAKPGPIETTSIIIGLPESSVFTYTFSLKTNDKLDFKDLIKEEAIKNIPLTEKELVYSYKILKKHKIEIEVDKKIKKKSIIDVSMVATSQKNLLMWQRFFQKFGIEIEFFDIETLALFRSMYQVPLQNHVCLIDMGTVSTNISIFSQEGLCYSHFIKKAGDLFTQNISEIRENAQGEKIGLEMAEKIKQEFGLSKDGKYGTELELVINSILYSISQEVKKTLVYHQVKFRKIISDVVLIGGSAKLKGVLEYFQKNLILENSLPPLPTSPPLAQEKNADEDKSSESLKSINNPVLTQKGVNVKIGQSYYLPGGNLLEYIEAIGIAVRGLDGRFNTDPFFEIVDIKKIEKEKILALKEGEKKKNQESQGKSWFKTHKKETQLIVILVVGLFFIGGAFWYRGQSAKKVSRTVGVAIDKFQFEKIIEYDLPLTVAYGNYNGTFVRGRSFKKTFTDPIEINALLRQGKEEAETSKKPGEELWAEPIVGPSLDKKIVFPVDFEWLLFFRSDTTGLIMDEIKRIMGDKEFMLSETEFINISKTDKSNAYNLRAKIKILTAEDFSENASATSTVVNVDEKISETTVENQNQSDKIDGEETAEVNSADELKKLLFKARANEGEGDILIKETETGWLNVRSGPGTGYDIVKKVQEGDSFNSLLEQDGWLKIDLGEEISGWVLEKYVDRK